MYKNIKNWKTHSLFVIVLLFLYLSVFANIILISASAEGIDLQIDAPKGAFVGNTITLKAKVDGTTEGLQYAFEEYRLPDDKQKEMKYRTLQGFKSNDNVKWTPQEAGRYKLWVAVKKDGKPIGCKSVIYEVKEPSTELKALVVSQESPQPVNTDITLKAKVDGTTEGLQYAFEEYRLPDDKQKEMKYRTLQGFKSNDTVKWTPQEAGRYKLWVAVKKDGKPIGCKSVIYEVKEPSTELKALVVSQESPQPVNTDITLKAKVDGSTEGLQYAFEEFRLPDGKQKEKKYRKLQDFSLKDQVEWTPKEPGRYDLWVSVKGKDGKVTQKNMIYEVKDGGAVKSPVCNYRGICNMGNTCSLGTSIQLLYHYDEFRNLVLNTTNIDKTNQPYLYALREQFLNIENNVISKKNGVGIEVAFDNNQVKELINGGDSSPDMTPRERLLDKCVGECKDIQLETKIKSMRDSFVGLTNFNFDQGETLEGNMAKFKGNDEITVGLYATKGFTYEKYSRLNIDGCKFELTGAFIHIVGKGDTHFYALVKDRPTGQWIKLDDSSATRIDDANAGKIIKDVWANQLIYSKVK